MEFSDAIQAIKNSVSQVSYNTTVTPENIDKEDLPKQTQRLKNKRFASDTSARNLLAIWTSLIVTLWLSAVAFILIANKRLLLGISDEVLMVLLGTTTINILGLSYIVLRGHFNSSSNEPPPNEQ